MRILLLGRNGQLGWELERSLACLGAVAALDYPEVDLALPEQLDGLVSEYHPQVVVNAAAYTAVDRAESEPELARLINSAAPGALAEAARRQSAAFVHYSTDYVFDGRKNSPYTETDVTGPLNAYGATKLAGEQAVAAAGDAWMILRTSWVYSLRRDSFVTKVLQWARRQAELRIVSDQVGSPTWARLLAEITAQMLAQGGTEVVDWCRSHRGLYHLAGGGAASRLEWAQAVLDLDPHPDEQVARRILPAQSTDFSTPAVRPLFSALDCSRFEQTFGLQLPPWRAALQLAMGSSAGIIKV